MQLANSWLAIGFISMPWDLPLAIDGSWNLRSVDQASRPRSSAVGRAIFICHAGSKRW